MTIVIDANILIAFALGDEPLHTEAKQVLSFWKTTNENLITPRLFRSEITAVMRKAVYQERISYNEGRKMLNQLLAYPVKFYEDELLLQTAYELAEYFKRPRAYDTQYMALAQRFACQFWTADERMFNAVSGQFSNIRWLGDWKNNL
jgi:predicted nucleic acid-binding protein